MMRRAKGRTRHDETHEKRTRCDETHEGRTRRKATRDRANEARCVMGPMRRDVWRRGESQSVAWRVKSEELTSLVLLSSPQTNPY